MARLEKILLDVFVHPRKSFNSLSLSLLKTRFVAGIVTIQLHKLYYRNEERTWGNTRWLGTKVLKCPLDLWTCQEI